MAERGTEMADDRLERLEVQMEAVLGSLERLNARLGISSDPAAPPGREPLPSHIDALAPETAGFVFEQLGEETRTPETHRTAPAPSSSEAVPPPAQIDWEDVVGRKWALWVGAIAVFLAVAFFLAYTWHNLTPAGRLTVGGCAGLVFLFGAEFARQRTQRGFSEGLAGGGLAILYLDAWAACARYNLATFDVALALMVGVAVLGFVLALRYDSRSLHALAAIGGFATPAVLQAGGGGSVQPFLWYLTVLNGGVLSVAVVRKWRANVVLSALATLALVGGWSESAPVMDHRWLVFCFVTINYVLYAVAAVYPALILRERTESTDWLLLLSCTAGYFAGGYALTDGLLGAIPASFPLALGVLMACTALMVRIQSPEDDSLMTVCIGLACSMGALAVPIQLRQQWICVGWSAEAAILLTIAAVSGSAVVRRAGQIVWVLACLALLLLLAGWPAHTARIVFNEHGIPTLAFALCSAWIARFRRGEGAAEARPLYAAACVLSGAWLVGEQVQYGFGAGLYTLPKPWSGGEMYIVSIALSLYAVTAHALNARWRDVEGRAAALASLAVSIAVILGMSGVQSAPAWTPVLNPRFLAYTVSIVCLVAIGWVCAGRNEQFSPAEAGVARATAPVVHILILVCCALEIVAAYALHPAPAMHEDASMAVAALCSAYAALLFLPAFSPERIEIRWLAVLAAGYGVFVLLANAFGTWDTCLVPLLNGRFAEFAIVAASLEAIAVLSKGVCGKGEETVPSAALIAAGTVALWAITQETWTTCAYFQTAIGDHWERWAQSAISVVWTVAASGLLLSGIAREQRVVRFAALGLFAATVAKVFLFDLRFLENQFRVLSFGGLGIGLIGISWLYSRYGKGQHGEGAFAHRR